MALYASHPDNSLFAQLLANVPRDLIYPKENMEESIQEAVLKAAGTTKGVCHDNQSGGACKQMLWFSFLLSLFSGKRILLQIGANWSQNCRALKSIILEHPEVALEIKRHWEVLFTDCEDPANTVLLQSLGYPTRLGVPVLVVVDMNGRYVHTQGTGFLEHDPIEAGLGAQPLKVLAFLQHWREGSIRERQKK
jgi:thiol:disulfide interchange protein